MGGRGASSGIRDGIVAFDVKADGITLSYTVRKGKVYDQSYDEIKLSANQIIEKAKNNGYEVKTYNAKQEKERQKARVKDREETNRFLDIQDNQVGGMRKYLRMDTRGRRGARRGI